MSCRHIGTECDGCGDCCEPTASEMKAIDDQEEAEREWKEDYWDNQCLRTPSPIDLAAEKELENDG